MIIKISAEPETSPLSSQHRHSPDSAPQAPRPTVLTARYSRIKCIHRAPGDSPGITEAQNTRRIKCLSSIRRV